VTARQELAPRSHDPLVRRYAATPGHGHAELHGPDGAAKPLLDAELVAFWILHDHKLLAFP
jgi:hypothetical protein